MKDINLTIGKNIKKLRQANKMTLVDISQKIHKGKSTFSKYENGEICIDVETFLEIAKVLNVSPQILLNTENSTCNIKTETGEMERKFIYFYDGRVKKIITGILEEFKTEDIAHRNAFMYFDVKDESSPGSCSSFYKGTMESYEFMDNYSFVNQNNNAERVWLCCLKTLRNTDYRLAALSGLSYKTMLPVSLKTFVSQNPISKDDTLKNALLLSRDNIRLTKKYNMFTMWEMP